MNDSPDRYSNPLGSDPWIPSISAEFAPSFDLLQSTLQVINRAQVDRSEGTPHGTDTELNHAQEEIRQTGVDAIRRIDDDVMEHLATASSHMVEDGEAINAAERVREVDASLTMIIRADEVLEQLAVDYVVADEERDAFVRNNALNPPAQYQEHLSMFVCALLVTMSVETGMNALVLKEVNGYGLIGGLGVSLMISVANGALGLAGGLGWRLLAHLRPSMKVAGAIVTAVATVGALGCNLIAAHYRQVAENTLEQRGRATSAFDSALTPGESDRAAEFFSSAIPRMEQLDAAVSHLRASGVLGFRSLWSWVLLMVGLGIFFTVCYKNFDDYGRYVGYRSRDVRRKRAKAAFDQQLRNIEDSAFGYIEEHKNACDAAAQQLEKKASVAYRVATQAERRSREMMAHVERWVQVINRLLRLYRETNAQGCSPASLPMYWDTYGTVDEYKQLLSSEALPAAPSEPGAESPIQSIRSRRKALDRILRNSRRERDNFAGITVSLVKAVPARMAHLRSRVLEWARGEAARLYPRAQ